MDAHSADDLNTAARIRNAAIRVFARDGFSKATVRGVAEEAGLSPSLVIYHYGNKAALQGACDHHVVTTPATREFALLSTGLRCRDDLYATDPEIEEHLRYLTRALQEGERVAEVWFDALVEHTRSVLEHLPAPLLQPAADPQARLIVIVMQALATLTLQSQAARHLSAQDGSQAGAYARLSGAITELHVRGLFTRDHPPAAPPPPTRTVHSQSPANPGNG